MSGRFLLLFTVTNTLAVTAFLMLETGTAAGLAGGLSAGAGAVTGIVMLARVLIATRPGEGQISNAELKEIRRRLR